MKSDRPFSRSIIKIGTRILLGGARAHAQDGFPGLAIRTPPSGNGDVFYKGRRVATLRPEQDLRGRAGAFVCILGSGPSMRESAPERMPPQAAIALNGAMTLFGTHIRSPLAVAVEDERFVFRHFALMREKIPPGLPCLFSVGVLRVICEYDPAWLADKPVVLIDNITKPYGSRRRKLSDFSGDPTVRIDPSTGAGFSLSPDRGVFQGGSVAVSAFQFALFCNPAAIGFMGVDISNAGGARFYEQPGSVAFSGIADAEARILAHIALGVPVARQRGVDLLNFSPVSALERCGLSYDDRYARSSALSVNAD